MSSQSEIKPKAGERWRITLEGEVLENSGDMVTMSSARGGLLIYTDEGTWERLPDPEPEWQPGDLVITASEAVLKRFEMRYQSGSGLELVWGYSGDRFPIFTEGSALRPLTRLIREDSK